MTTVSDRKLTLGDIADLRAYERERDEFRTHVIALKKKRRIGVGPFVTFVFESRDTIRFQIQEMARAEKILTDEGITTELDIYNPLIPEPGHLAATMFIELTSEEDLRLWLPELVGIEATVELRVGPERTRVRCTVDADHAAQLTRDNTTAAVHYVHFELSDAEIDAVAAGPVALAITHPRYEHETQLAESTVAELLGDLRSS